MKNTTLHLEIPAPVVPPPLRLDRPLPPYRYIPGRHPHPSKDPRGHFHCTPPVPLSQPETSWAEHPCWLRGLDLFDHRYYWECHEQLELIWHQLSRSEPHHTFVQGLIQAAAFRLKWHMQHETSARTLLLACKKRLEFTCAQLGTTVWGVEIDALLAQLEQVETASIWPVLFVR